MINDLENMLKQIVGNQKVFSKICKVDSVDNDKLTCDVYTIEDDTFYDNVSLSPTNTGNFIQFPKVDSIVIVSFLDDSNCFVSQMSEIEGYYISNEDNSFLDLMNDLFTAISNIQVQTNYGASLPKSVVNQAEFNSVQDKFKNLFLK